jgi:hypothetical protein
VGNGISPIHEVLEVMHFFDLNTGTQNFIMELTYGQHILSVHMFRYVGEQLVWWKIHAAAPKPN